MPTLPREDEFAVEADIEQRDLVPKESKKSEKKKKKRNEEKTGKDAKSRTANRDAATRRTGGSNGEIRCTDRGENLVYFLKWMSFLGGFLTFLVGLVHLSINTPTNLVFSQQGQFASDVNRDQYRLALFTLAPDYFGE